MKTELTRLEKAILITLDALYKLKAVGLVEEGGVRKGAAFEAAIQALTEEGFAPTEEEIILAVDVIQTAGRTDW